MKHRISPIAAALVLGLGSGLAVAAKFDPATAIDIEQAVAKARQQYPDAQVIEAELEDDHGGLWEIELVTADGRRHKVNLDARTGEPWQRGKR